MDPNQKRREDELAENSGTSETVTTNEQGTSDQEDTGAGATEEGATKTNDAPENGSKEAE